MKAHLFLMLGVVLGLNSQGQMESVELFSQGTSTVIDRFAVPLDHIQRLAKWSPITSSKPPLSMSTALSLAIPSIESAAKGWPWDITAVSMSEGRTDEAKGVWYYHIYCHIDLSQSPSSIRPVFLPVVVLLDGTVLVPEVEVPDRDTPASVPTHGVPDKAYHSATEIELFFQGNKNVENHYFVTKEEADQLPEWHPESGKPLPFDVEDALSILHQRIADKIPGQDWRFLQFTIKPGSFPESRHIWWYHVNILHRPKNHSGEENLWHHCILLDGTVLSAEPDSFAER